MASLKDIKSRISSVKSTQKITNAMKLVSAAKFSRANHAVESARPYAEAFARMVSHLLASVEVPIMSPFLDVRPEKKALFVIVATDRGLCGGLNSNLFKTSLRFLEKKCDEGVDIDLFCCGKRAVSFGKKTGLTIIHRMEKVLEKPGFNEAQEIAEKLSQLFIDGKYDRIHVGYPKYKSALEQLPTVEQLLPLVLKSQDQLDQVSNRTDLIIEPKLEDFLDHLLRRQIYGYFYHVLLNGAASEHGARMTAMDAATNNAKEVIRKLTLEYNRARQAAITTELTEIISGAEAIS